MKVGELIQSVNDGVSIDRVSRNLHLQPINLAKVLVSMGYVYEEGQWIWKHKGSQPIEKNIEDYIIRVLGMGIGELISRLNSGESVEALSEKLGLDKRIIPKLLKVLGYKYENDQWVWTGQGRPPLNYNVLEFVVSQKSIWQRLIRWVIILMLAGLIFYGFTSAIQGKTIGDFYSYKVEATVLKNRFGKDHLLIKHNGKYYLLPGQGNELSKIKGNYLKVLIFHNKFGFVWYKLSIPEK